MSLSLGEVAMGRYAISLLTTDERTSSGLYLPHGKETLQNVGRILKAGPPYQAADDDDDESPFGPRYKVGQVVVFGKYNGNEITLEADTHSARTKFIIIAESDILCTLNEDKPNASA